MIVVSLVVQIGLDAQSEEVVLVFKLQRLADGRLHITFVSHHCLEQHADRNWGEVGIQCIHAVVLAEAAGVQHDTRFVVCGGHVGKIGNAITEEDRMAR